MLLCFAFVVLLTTTCVAIPPVWRIDVPYHRQITDFCCGDASLQMVLQYWDPTVRYSIFGEVVKISFPISKVSLISKANISQNDIMNVMRTSEQQGTLSVDIVRGAQFSVLSSAVGILYQNITVVNGYPGKPLGLAAFWHDSTAPWIQNLKVISILDSHYAYTIIILNLNYLISIKEIF